MGRFLALLVAVLILASIACSGDPEGRAGPAVSTPIDRGTPPSPTAVPAAPLPAGFRAFAAQIDAALRRGDRAFFADRAATAPVVCTAQDVPPRGLGGPACDFVGQTYDGLVILRYGSEGGTIPLDSALDLVQRLWAEALPAAGDAYGSGAPRVRTIGEAQFLDMPAAAAVMTALIERPANFAGAGPLRVVIVSHWRDHGGEWRLVGLTSAFVLAEAFLDPAPNIRQRFSSWEPF
jgi:hypothetical protein